jgi:LysM repeat protein
MTPTFTVMNDDLAQQTIQSARKALLKGDLHTARKAAESVAQAAPHYEQPWLLLAVVSSPKAAEFFLNKALSVNPNSPYARAGLDWLAQKASGKTIQVASLMDVIFPELVRGKRNTSHSRNNPLFAILGVLIVVAIIAGFGFFGVGGNKAAPSDKALQLAQATLTALSLLPTETSTPTPSATPTATSTVTASRTLTRTSTRTPTAPPTLTQSPEPTDTRQPTVKPTQTARNQTYTVKSGDTLNSIALRFGLPVASLISANNLPNASYIQVGQVLVIPSSGSIPLPTQAPPTANDGKWILIDISEQHMYAYEDDRLIYSFVASTGIGNSTRIGTFKVLDKIPNAYSQRFNIWMPYWMGIYYSGTLENGIHGLPKLWNGVELWGNLLGRPATYGCIETRTSEAKLIYDWAEIGTKVVIRP